MTPTLSILIPSLVTRSHHLDAMLAQLHAQRDERVEVLTEIDDGEASTGEKRNRLVARATGLYVAHVDDDDTISPRYVQRLLAAAAYAPDMIGFRMARYVDGVEVGIEEMSIRHPVRRIDATPRIIAYYYPPTHLNPTRIDLARAVQFPHTNKGEDVDWGQAIYPLLRSEVWVDETLYTYLYRTQAMRQGERANQKRGK